jgi:hypothetical protein
MKREYRLSCINGAQKDGYSKNEVIRAFYRYESGEITQCKSTDLILKLLAKNAVDVGTLIEVSNQYSEMTTPINPLLKAENSTALIQKNN